MTFGILLAVCVILLAVRLPAFLNRLGVSTRDKIMVSLFMFALLLGVVFAFDIFGQALALFRSWF